MSQPHSRILIADEHEAMRLGVRLVLEGGTNWQIVGEAADGLEALELARETQPNIAIIDYSLPAMNGLELTRAMKRELPHTEILVYTMYDRESILSQVLDAGALGYVLKSDPTIDLIAAVEALGRRQRYLSATIMERLDSYFIEQGRDIGSAPLLTPREREVVQLIATGAQSKHIANTLNISVKTVETHRAKVMRKLKIQTLAGIVRYAVRNEIVQV